MTRTSARPPGAGNLPLACGIGLLIGIAGFTLAYLIGPRTDSVPAVPLAVFAGLGVGGPVTWRMYRHGWRLFHDGQSIIGYGLRSPRPHHLRPGPHREPLPGHGRGAPFA